METIRSFFYEHNCRSEELLEQRLREIPQAVRATEDAAVVDSGTAMVRALLDLIAVLRSHIAALDRQIAAPRRCIRNCRSWLPCRERARPWSLD